MADQTDNGYDAIVVGGGVIGLACAWRAARRGARVCVLERDHPAAGATGVAAGMLAPVGRGVLGRGARCSPSTSSRCGAGRASPASSRRSAEAGGRLRRAAAPCTSRSTATRPRSCAAATSSTGASGSSPSGSPGAAAAQLEPGLATAVRGGAHVPGEASVDPRRVVAALLAALERRGGRGPVRRGGRLRPIGTGCAWRLETRGRPELRRRPSVVLAAGCWSGRRGLAPAGGAPAGAAGQGRDPDASRPGRRAGLRADRRRRAGLHGAPRPTAG